MYKMEKRIRSQMSQFSVKIIITETTKFMIRVIFNFILFGILVIFAYGSSVGLMLLLGLILINVRKSVKVAFSDPYDINYKRKTNKELFTYFAQSCIIAFLLAIISFHILIYIALLLWFNFIVFMLKFSAIWKYHGKNTKFFFALLTVSIIISFILAPFARNLIYNLLFTYK